MKLAPGNLAVIGYPIGHSLSPVMQNAALAALGLNFFYIALPIKPEDLALGVSFLKAADFRGFNVTIPHKSAIIPLLDEVTEDARIIGAVNTVVNEGGRLLGHNTDYIGFLSGLKAAGFEPKGKKAVILGAGGGARAILWGLIKSGAKEIVIGARNGEKASRLASDLSSHGKEGQLVKGFSWDAEEFLSALKQADLLVNATPLGMTPKTEVMAPIPLELLPQGAFVSDIIYTPPKTKLLAEAEKLGHTFNNGEDMLVAQGAAAFELWTGAFPDVNIMKDALIAFLKESN